MVSRTRWRLKDVCPTRTRLNGCYRVSPSTDLPVSGGHALPWYLQPLCPKPGERSYLAEADTSHVEYYSPSLLPGTHARSHLCWHRAFVRTSSWLLSSTLQFLVLREAMTCALLFRSPLAQCPKGIALGLEHSSYLLRGLSGWSLHLTNFVASNEMPHSIARSFSTLSVVRLGKTEKAHAFEKDKHNCRWSGIS